MWLLPGQSSYMYNQAYQYIYNNTTHDCPTDICRHILYIVQYYIYCRMYVDICISQKRTQELGS